MPLTLTVVLTAVLAAALAVAWLPAAVAGQSLNVDVGDAGSEPPASYWGP